MNSFSLLIDHSKWGNLSANFKFGFVCVTVNTRNFELNLNEKCQVLKETWKCVLRKRSTNGSISKNIIRLDFYGGICKLCNSFSEENWKTGEAKTWERWWGMGGGGVLSLLRNNRKEYWLLVTFNESSLLFSSKISFSSLCKSRVRGGDGRTEGVFRHTEREKI